MSTNYSLNNNYLSFDDYYKKNIQNTDYGSSNIDIGSALNGSSSNNVGSLTDSFDFGNLESLKSYENQINQLQNELSTMNLNASTGDYSSQDYFNGSLLNSTAMSSFNALKAGGSINSNGASCSSSLGSSSSSIVNDALQYIGYNESNGSYKKFTNGRNEAWCADFVTYVVKEACAKEGKQVPAGFGSASVAEIRSWAQNNGKYISGNNTSNVKPGDLVIFNDASHIGIVQSVDSNGTVHTIEGNTSDQVAQRTYSGGNGRITGFVSM